MRGISEIGGGVVAQRQLVRRVGRVVHAQQPGAGLGVIAGPEGGQRAGVLGGGEDAI